MEKEDRPDGHGFTVVAWWSCFASHDLMLVLNDGMLVTFGSIVQVGCAVDKTVVVLMAFLLCLSFPSAKNPSQGLGDEGVAELAEQSLGPESHAPNCQRCGLCNEPCVCREAAASHALSFGLGDVSKAKQALLDCGLALKLRFIEHMLMVDGRARLTGRAPEQRSTRPKPLGLVAFCTTDVERG